MKSDLGLPSKYPLGSLHSEGIPCLGRNATFRVLGWYINHCNEQGVIRFIKDGNALAIRLVNARELQRRADVTKTSPVNKRSLPVRRSLKPSIQQRNFSRAKSRLVAIGLLTQEEADKLFDTDKWGESSKSFEGLKFI